MKTPFSLLKPELLENISEQASKLLPNEGTREEMQRTVQVLVQNALAKLDLVSREEFDAQAAVLQKTRSKIEALEVQVKALEKALENNKN